MRLWRHTDQLSEGKYLVVRRDGTVPHWPHFVLGAMDPAAPAALLAYADEAERLGMEADYVHSIRDEANRFDSYRRRASETGQKRGDPDKGPHRTDHPLVLSMMRHEFQLSSLLQLFGAMAALLIRMTPAGKNWRKEDVLKALEQMMLADNQH